MVSRGAPTVNQFARGFINTLIATGIVALIGVVVS